MTAKQLGELVETVKPAGFQSVREGLFERRFDLDSQHGARAPVASRHLRKSEPSGCAILAGHLERRARLESGNCPDAHAGGFPVMPAKDELATPPGVDHGLGQPARHQVGIHECVPDDGGGKFVGSLETQARCTHVPSLRRATGRGLDDWRLLGSHMLSG